MRMNNIEQALLTISIVASICIAGCRTSTAPAGAADTATLEYKTLAPQRVDIRGSIIRRQYDQGQVMLEVEGFPSQNSRYNRAYVLVLPTTQIIGTDGESISLSELQQGQQIAILLRSGGQGNFVGLGVARKAWIEEAY